MQNASECGPSVVPFVGNRVRQRTPTIDNMLRAVRALTDVEPANHADPKINIATKLYRCGFTASDIIENIDDVLEAL